MNTTECYCLTASHDMFITNLFLSKDGVILVCDAKNEKSLDGLDYWVNQCKENGGGLENITIVCNRMDEIQY